MSKSESIIITDCVCTAAFWESDFFFSNWLRQTPDFVVELCNCNEGVDPR